MDDFYTPEDRQLALSQGLLGLGAGLLSGSYGQYGAFAPALSTGAAGFQQGYQSSMENALKVRQWRQNQLLQNAQIQNYQSEIEKRKAELAEQQRLRTAAQDADNFANGGSAASSGVPQSYGVLAPPQQSYGVLAPEQTPGLLSGPGATALAGGSGVVGGGAGYGATGALAPGAANSVPVVAPTQGPNGDFFIPTTSVTEKPVSNLLDPNWHLKRAEFLYKVGDRKGAEEAAKRSIELRNENFKQDEAANKAPATKLIPVDDTHEQMYEWDKQNGQWKKTGSPRLIFNPSPVVSVDMKQENAAAAKMGTTDAEMVGEYQKNAINAQRLLPVLKRMEKNVDTVFSGTGANFATDLGNLATTLGVANPDLIKKVGNSEQAISDVAELVRAKIKALGSGSAISNTDLLFTNRSMPDLVKTPAGRKMIIAAMKADIANISNDHQAARSWFDSHNKSLAGFVPPSTNAEPIDFGSINNRPPPKLMKGQVVDGYKYNGGDPSQQSSWELQ